jgi:hypothetical protein
MAIFPPSSRYAKCPTYAVALANGTVVTAVAIPGPRSPKPIGYHPRAVGDRLDLLAVKYLNDPTGFWRICDANDAPVAGALEARSLIGIPAAGSSS